jgi:hypothetical protein
MIELNALDVLNRRKIDFIAPQFSKIKISEGDLFGDDLEDWIKTKLKGRFYLQKTPGLGTDGKVRSVTYLGFEDHKELTYFMLACPHLRRK